VTEFSDQKVEIEDGGSPRALFPGHYALDEGQRRAAFQRGLVSLDANALLDLYRFTPRGREDFFDVLTTMKSRLFLTHQTAREFYRNRLQVVKERIADTADEGQRISEDLKQVSGKLKGYSRRYQWDHARRDALVLAVDKLAKEIESSLIEASAYDLDPDDVRLGSDIVLRRFDELFEGRIGRPLTATDHKAALAEAERRIAGRIPPGYADAKKGEEEDRRAGDYLLWLQLIGEAKKHDSPVLLISNEEKEDWVAKFHGEIIGPRPELVLEFQQETGVYFHKVTVAGLLANASKYLGRAVSADTVAEAQEFSPGVEVELGFSPESLESLDSLPAADQQAFNAALERIISAYQRGDNPVPPAKRVKNGDKDVAFHLLDFGAGKRALLSVRKVRSKDREPEYVVRVLGVHDQEARAQPSQK